MKRAILIFVLLLAGPGGRPARGEIIDRVAAVVGRQAITRSEVEREARLEAFFSGRPPDGGAANRQILERLIRQQLVRQETQQTTLPSADDAQVKKWLEEMRPPAAEPGAYGLQEKDLFDYARRQIDTLRFVELRFKPGLQIAPRQIETYYEETLLPELKRKGVSPSPALDEVRSRIEQVLVEQRVNELLDEWLTELRTRVLVRVMEEEKP